MSIKLLHLNIEKNKHLSNVKSLLREVKPDVVCFQEVMKSEIEKMASSLGYQFTFAPSLIIRGTDIDDEEGCAILSKIKIESVDIYRYDSNNSNVLPVRSEKETLSIKNKRPKDRFYYHAPLLVVSLKNEKTQFNICTTHFPVVDHYKFGLLDHHLEDINDVGEIEKVRDYFDRLLNIISGLHRPIIFTSDLNNPRGEFIYDTLAHELVDIVPKGLESSIDPILHRRQNLKLMIDTIMTSPDVKVNKFIVIEGVSDHKGFFTELDIL